ncbi:MAG: fibronectin type III domain-containing protein [candidate division Zixibacteria bacterium]|nr:fibronectin type III domain-containing protein [candidate division Zixibacteria bacterium]
MAAPTFGQMPDDGVITFEDTVQVMVAAPTSLIATDHKYDDGEKIDLQWVPSIDDLPGIGTVVGYRIYRQDDGGVAEVIANLPAKANHYRDENTELGHTYIYSVAALTDGAEFMSNLTESISPEREWIDFSKRYLFLIALLVGGAVIYFIEIARRGKKLFVRKIAGLEAVDDAVGRATEMGRPILFIPGIQDMDDVQTLAGLTILGRISKTIADYDTEIFMPVSRSLVMTAGREIIKSSYQTAGRPEKYSDNMVTYITDEQFGYVAAVDGIMVREKPATVFLLGAFFAESLILAETGNYIGAIQIAGTARPAQLPFFIAACDFTLIGEELFAASAYLSEDPKALGSLKGQDVGKAVAMVIIVVGVLAATMGQAWDISSMNSLVDILKTIFSTS